MIRIVVAVAIALVPVGASSQTMQDALDAMDRSTLVQGIAGIIRAEQDCEFTLQRDALNEYLQSQGLLDPAGLAEIDNQIFTARQLTEPQLSSTQCAMREATAKELGILAP